MTPESRKKSIRIMVNTEGSVEDKSQRRELCSSWARCDIATTERQMGEGMEATETRLMSEGLNSTEKGCTSRDLFRNIGPPTVKAPSLPVCTAPSCRLC